MENIKDYITTLVTALILITAVEIIAPDKPIKKYIKFVMGLIFISVMLNPIIYLLTKGETEVISTIKKYENNFTSQITTKSDDVALTQKEKSFKENLNKNCESMLQKKFEDLKFKSEIECTFDFDKMTYSIDNVAVGVSDNNVRLIEKVSINIGKSKEVISNENEIEAEEDIISYLMETLNVPREKIEIYNLNG